MKVSQLQLLPLELQRRNQALRLFKQLGSALKWSWVVLALVAVGFGLVSLLPALLFDSLANGLVQKVEGSYQEFLLHFALLAGLVAFAQFISRLGHSLTLEWWRLKVEAELRRRLFLQCHDLPLTTFDEGEPRGRLPASRLNEITGDLSFTERFFIESLPGQLRDAAVLLGTLVFFAEASGRLVGLPLMALIGLGISQRIWGRDLAKAQGEVSALRQSDISRYTQGLFGIRTLRSHRGEPFVQRQFEKDLAEKRPYYLKRASWVGMIAGAGELGVRVLAVTYLVLVATAFFQGTITFASVLMLPFFVGLFSSAALRLADRFQDWRFFFQQGGRFAELLEGETNRGFSSNRGLENRDLIRAAGLEFSDLSVSRSGTAVVESLNFSVQRHELLAILGPTGSGKSTLVEFLSGLRPALSGSAKVFDGGGKQWERQPDSAFSFPLGIFALVEQSPYLFEGSLRDNLTFGNPSRLSDVALWETLEQLGLGQWVMGQGGLDFQVGARSPTLSSGKRYRIALGRALLLRRPFLVCDDPFSTSEESSWGPIIQVLSRETFRAGVVVATPFLPEVLDVDQVLDLSAEFRATASTRQNGTVRENGSPGFDAIGLAFRNGLTFN